ncbi:hypothetical protein OE88DRAFT_1656237 [Heliocybe sulcata]|uniref:NAD(P)-binding protein n=1 Tax=Heliocybe sulcata TaxID=5364 RepID=A0A5C3N693_9AGAM|nr:hypothetical protein OE88DRAFT_1656237 [Heliocybe sulcata]
MSNRKSSQKTVNVPPATRRHIANGSLLSLTSVLLPGLNRLYAWWSSAINYVNYGFLDLFLGGFPPTYHTRPRPREGYKPAVFVTGAHDGIGRAIAFTLAESGWTVFAGVRKADDVWDLSRLFEEYTNALKSSSGNKEALGSLAPIVCDVLDQSSIQSAVGEVTSSTAADWKAKPLWAS